MSKVVGMVVSAALVVLAVGCAAASPDTPTLERRVTQCQVGVGGTADRRCDPGVRDPQVRQDTIHVTICVPGWAETVRPPTSYTTPLKREDMTRYGLRGSPQEYRYDHLLALSLGGSPADPNNLWPQPVRESYVKDQDTRRLKTRVCAGEVTLWAAQEQILVRWSH